MEKNYHNYQWSDFLEDNDFLAWVKDPDSPLSIQFFEKIRTDQIIFEKALKAKEIYKNLQYKKLSLNTSKVQIWKKIENEIRPQSNSTRKLWPIILSAAASISLILYFTVFKIEYHIEKSQVAEHKLIRLPDSSYVTLNAESSIEYDLKTYNKKRIIHLKGEAFFQVKAGTEFKVKTDFGEVSVLGTSFNVFSRNDFMNVTCLSGKVLVMFINNKTPYTLTSGMTVKNEYKVISHTQVDMEDFRFWRDGYFYYNNTPLSQVLDELRRQYKINNIEYSNKLLHYKYTGFFKKDNLNEAIESVFLPLKLNASYQNGVLRIKE